MTNLSKELCEICGVKPQIVEDYELNEYKIYPDFEQPENFLKLMELRVKGLQRGNLTLMGILNKEYWLNDRQDYIRFLCQYFIPDLTPYCQNKLKQAIRETEWVYG